MTGVQTCALPIYVVEKIIKITKGITLDDGQIDRLSSLPSYRWAKDSYAETVNKIKEFKSIIADYNAILKDKEKMRAIYRKEIQELKKMPVVER